MGWVEPRRAWETYVLRVIALVFAIVLLRWALLRGGALYWLMSLIHLCMALAPGMAVVERKWEWWSWFAFSCLCIAHALLNLYASPLPNPDIPRWSELLLLGIGFAFLGALISGRVRGAFPFAHPPEVRAMLKRLEHIAERKS